MTDTILTAASLVGARRFIAHSFCGWPFAREGGPVKTEEDPWHIVPLVQAHRSPAWIAGWCLGTVASRVLIV